MIGGVGEGSEGGSGSAGGALETAFSVPICVATSS